MGALPYGDQLKRMSGANGPPPRRRNEGVGVCVCMYICIYRDWRRSQEVGRWLVLHDGVPARVCCIVGLYADPTVNLLSIDLLQSLG